MAQPEDGSSTTPGTLPARLGPLPGPLLHGQAPSSSGRESWLGPPTPSLRLSSRNPVTDALQATNTLQNAMDSLAQTWQTALRSEAQQRLAGGFAPLQLTNMALDDWDLLKKVGGARSVHHHHAGSTGGPGGHAPRHAPPPLLGSSTPSAMKRCASENSIDLTAQGGSRSSKHLSSKHSQWPSPLGLWEPQHSSTTPGSPDQQPATAWPSAGLASSSQYAEAHASAMQAMARRPIGLLPATEQQGAVDDDDELDATATIHSNYSTSHLLRGRRSHEHAKSSPGLWSGALDRGKHGPNGMPRVPTAPSLQELSESLNHRASRNLEAVRAALQNAQASIQETATNCQQNLATLSNIFQQNLSSSGGPLQAALSNSRAIMTWSISNSGDPLGGVLVPWQVFPRVLRARELDAQGLLTAGSSSGDASDLGSGSSSSRSGGGSGSGTMFDWVTPLEQYMNQLDARQARQQRKGGSIKDPGRQVAIVTTASLPWMTGTSVNPLLRAAYLSSDGNRKVTLVLPWLSPADQQRVFPTHVHFDTPEQQEEYVRNWARQRTGLDCNFKVTFYPGRYAAEKGSILPVGDITQCIPDHEADVAVLEEPEHLNWYHHGARWTDKFNHVVGVMHTNYLDYARREENGPVKEMLLRHINAWMCRIHCHKVIKLSDAVQPLPRQDTMFVHGVSPAFLRVGEAKAQAAAESPGSSVFSKGAYFLGKVLWAKGYTELLDRLNEHSSRTGQRVHVDVYGSGPDLKAVEEEASRRRLELSFNGARDHADTSLQEYKVFINPSLSDVVATTTAEALAMGKWVVCADHPSNRFFERFPNCLIYRSSEEFTHCLQRALKEDPRPLSPSQLHDLTWEAATDRFLDVADISTPVTPIEASMDSLLHAVHNTLTGVEFLRQVAGAGTHTRDMPARITDYTPDENDVGGFFDNAARAKRSWEGKKPGGGVAKGAAGPQAPPAAATVKA